jgi:hypothetical protein
MEYSTKCSHAKLWGQHDATLKTSVSMSLLVQGDCNLIDNKTMIRTPNHQYCGRRILNYFELRVLEIIPSNKRS